MPDAIYKSENCQAAYQLDWSYSVFWHRLPPDDSWLEPLRVATEAIEQQVNPHIVEEVSRYNETNAPLEPAVR